MTAFATLTPEEFHARFTASAPPGFRLERRVERGEHFGPEVWTLFSTDSSDDDVAHFPYHKRTERHLDMILWFAQIRAEQGRLYQSDEFQAAFARRVPPGYRLERADGRGQDRGKDAWALIDEANPRFPLTHWPYSHRQALLDQLVHYVKWHAEMTARKKSGRSIRRCNRCGSFVDDAACDATDVTRPEYGSNYFVPPITRHFVWCNDCHQAGQCDCR